MLELEPDFKAGLDGWVDNNWIRVGSRNNLCCPRLTAARCYCRLSIDIPPLSKLLL